MTKSSAARRLLMLTGSTVLVVAALAWLALDPGNDDWPNPAPARTAESRPAHPATENETVSPVSTISGGSPAVVSGRPTLSALQRAIAKAYDGDKLRAKRAADSLLPDVLGATALSTPSGRSHAMTVLATAENLASERLASAELEMNSVLAMARSSNLETAVKAQVLADLEQTYTQSLQQHRRLHAAQMQANSISRGLVQFMEDNQASYDSRLGQPVFQTAAMTVQFNHYMAQVSLAVGRESKLEHETQVTREREQLLLQGVALKPP